MERKRLSVVKWDGLPRAHVISFSRKNLWRVTPEYDLDDLVQEGRIAFWKCTEAYPEIVDERVFMNIFRAAFGNRVNTLVAKRMRHREVLECQLPEEITLDRTAVGRDPGSIDFQLFMEDAPEPLVEVVYKIAAQGREARLQGAGAGWETTNEYLCRLAGVDPERYNLRETFKGWFSGDRRVSDLQVH